MNNTISTKEVLQRIRELADAYGRFYERYSGRCMFGEHCVGVVTDRPHSVINDTLRCAIEGHRTDSMGRDTIVYWPHIQMSVAPTSEPLLPTSAERANSYLTDYLRGYGRGNLDRLRAISQRNQWAAHAGAVLDKRQYKFLEALDDAVLLEIETGGIDVRVIAACVVADLQALENEGGNHE